MTEKRFNDLANRKKILIDQLKIMELYPEDTINHFGSQKKIEERVDEILDELILIEKLLKT